MTTAIATFSSKNDTYFLADYLKVKELTTPNEISITHIVHN